MIGFFLTILCQGLIYAILALGVYISYSILDFQDLTADGAYVLGAAVAAQIVLAGGNPWIACAVGIIAGGGAGFLTASLHVFGKITNLLSGIITMTALYSINLVIMGKPNLSIALKPSIFGGMTVVGQVWVLLAIVVAIKLVLDWFFETRAGFMIRAVGSNPQLVTSMGGSIGVYKIIGLAISGGLIALAGALAAQAQGFVDIGMSSGTVVLGLTCVIIGMSLKNKFKFLEGSNAAIIGALIYQAVIGVALWLGMPTMLLKLTTAVILIVVLLLGKEGKRNART